MTDRRIMLKVSGEQLGTEVSNFDVGQAVKVCRVLEALKSANFEIACVMGGGNVVRGKELFESGFENEVIADHMGMLATIQNGLFLYEVLKSREKCDGRLFSNIPTELVESFSYRRAIKCLDLGHVALVAGGLGKPGFTTDTAVVSQAFELHCSAIVKTTKVDGVYDKDPAVYDDAIRYHHLSFDEVHSNPSIKVMDRAALELAAGKNITIAICQLDPDNVLGVLNGDTSKGTIIS